MTRPTPQLMRVGEVAALYCVDARTVTKWCQAGLLPAQRTLGNHRRIPVAAVHAALVAGGVTSTEAYARIAAAVGQVGS